ncbi:hypothetical protein DVW87_07540 [Sphingomonas aracearum]|uniref:DOMON-like domain-containing protein n=1 Tax=Sphingomonas aracearum TaxID=2283317 RepID=A0A369VYD3_9SPHN|nr:hypothetical protein DVW87_07540 [Sphingomonas aracearum]
MVPHPSHPPGGVQGVRVQLDRQDGAVLRLEYIIRHTAPLALPSVGPAERADALWKTTCFELFLSQEEVGYCEFNFSPSTRWAAYRFDSYRGGMADLPLASAPEIAASRAAGTFTLAVEAELPVTASSPRMSLTAVIEEQDGTRSFWALAHADGPPDFHNPACFTATLPARGAA